MKTKITELLQIEYPIFQGGMAWVAEHNLAAAVSNAGGLGIIGAASAPPEVVREEIRKCKELTDKPFGVNIMLLNPNAEEVAKIVVEEGVQAVTTGAGNPGKFMELWKNAGVKVIPVVASVAMAKMMERAGAEDMGDDVERKGLGTPATRADIIEKLVKDGFVKREKKQIIPTEDGMKLITILPDVVKSPKLTADWDNELTLVSKGEVAAEQFMSGIEAMVTDLVKTYHSVSDEQKAMFGTGKGGQEVLGKCPKCGADVVRGKFGAYCTGKCGMNVGKALGVTLSDTQVKSLLQGKKILVKGLKGKKGSYDAYLIPESVQEFSYTKDGKEIKGFQYKFKMEFPPKKDK